jgi:hypothetical protein
MDLFVRILQTSAIAIGIPLALSLLARLFPYKPADLAELKIDFSELQIRYAKWEVAALIPFFAFSFLSGYLIFRGLVWVLHHSIPQGEGSRFLMLPDEYFFALPALFIGILVGAAPTDLLYRLLLKERYAEYTLYGNLKTGFDSWRVIKFLALTIIIPSALLTCLAMDCYAGFTDDRMITNRFWGIGENVRAYQQITRIRQVQSFKAPNGNIIERPFYVLHFNDGSTWSTKNQLYRFAEDSDLNQQKEAELIIFIAGKIGKEVEVQKFSDKD